jgi:peptidoglycan/LPS O-acetylase OafA/YrhL
MSPTSVALSNLRAFVILIVLGFHSVLAYLGSNPPSVDRLDVPPYRWQSFPIIDSQRWFGFDLLCAWNDVCLMSLMYFLSGLFVYQSLRRKGSWGFLSDRLLRLGLPLVLAVYVLMPVALYPAYLVTTPDPSVAEFWRQFRSLPFWPCGPQWFLWQLLALNIVVAGVHWIAPRWGEVLARLAVSSRDNPSRFIALLLAASAVAYVPLAAIFSPWEWYQIGPFAFQYCRPLHYTVYFLAGVAVGAHGLERGLLAPDGVLVRRWPFALAAAIAGLAIWMTPMAIITEMADPAPLWLATAADVGFVICCAAGCLAAVAAALRFASAKRAALDSLSSNAYGMYLVHYPFVVWAQYALLDAALPAFAKAAIVFAVLIVLSWGASAALGSIPLGGRLLGTARRAVLDAPSSRSL